MALTTQQAEAYKSFLTENADLFASDENSIVEPMSDASFKKGLECGSLSLSNLNCLLLGSFLNSSYAIKESNLLQNSTL